MDATSAKTEKYIVADTLFRASADSEDVFFCAFQGMFWLTKRYGCSKIVRKRTIFSGLL